MNAPEVNTLLAVNDVFVRLVQTLKGEVIRELLNSGIVGSLQSRVDALEHNLAPTALQPLTARQVGEMIEEALDSYNPTDFKGFTDSVKEIMEEDGSNVASKIRTILREDVSVNIEVNY